MRGEIQKSAEVLDAVPVVSWRLRVCKYEWFADQVEQNMVPQCT